MPSFEVDPVAQKVIGSGIRAPFQFSVGRSVRSVAGTGGLEKIQQSMRDILLTRPGERLNMPEYGSRLFDLAFEPGDPPTNALLWIYTVKALSRWEPRIEVLSAEFLEDDNNPNYLGIMINFRVLATNQIGNYVFPFARQGVAMSDAVTGFEQSRILQSGYVEPAASPFTSVGTKG